MEELDDETIACSLLLLGALAVAHGSAAAQTLEGFATFPADTFAPGPTSGQLIAPANGRLPPFEDQQPVQGISSVLAGSHDDFWIMADNTFGAGENSSDFVNDNNYPFSAGRVPGQPDPNEFILIKSIDLFRTAATTTVATIGTIAAREGSSKWRRRPRASVTPTHMRLDLRFVTSVESQNGTGYTERSWVVEDGRPGAQAV